MARSRKKKSMSTRPASSSAPIAVAPSRGVHLFEVANYSHHRDLPVRSFLRSATFDFGGCAWCLRFYPNGKNRKAENQGYVAVALELMTQDATVTVSSDMRLVDKATGAHYASENSKLLLFETRCVEEFEQVWCVPKFMMKSELEASTFLRDDRLVIECTLRLIRGTHQRLPPEIDVLPSDLPDHLGSLLKEGMGADVTFDVQGKSFPAHRMPLAARSPVFKAELLGPMKEGSANRIAVHEIQPEVFEALLYFIYTDSLPSMHDEINLIGDLLAAADRYAMDRLKLVCERTLSRSLKMENASSLFVLANRHNCSGLRDACAEFVVSHKMNDATRTEGYAGFKRHHPLVLTELFEKAVKFLLGRRHGS